MPGTNSTKSSHYRHCSTRDKSRIVWSAYWRSPLDPMECHTTTVKVKSSDWHCDHPNHTKKGRQTNCLPWGITVRDTVRDKNMNLYKKSTLGRLNDLFFVFFRGGVNKGGTTSEYGFALGQGFFRGKSGFTVPVGAALITLCFGCFLLWGCHGSTYKVRFYRIPIIGSCFHKSHLFYSVKGWGRSPNLVPLKSPMASKL